MKKIYSLFTTVVLFAGVVSAQCTINPGQQTTPGVNPTADNLPCVERGVAYDQTLQGQIQTSQDTTISGFPVTVYVDSMSLDSIANLPAGIIWNKNPNILLGGGNGCVQFTGTATAPTGRYYIEGWGRAWLRITSPIAYSYTYNGQLNQFSPFGGYYLDVINSGTTCDHAALGVNDFSADLNAAFSVYPNPTSGVIKLNLNAGSRVNGEIRVADVTGKLIYAEKLDVIGLYNTTIDLSGYSKGLYTVQLRTAEGFASKNISIE